MPQSTQAQLSGVAPLRSILLMPRRFYARRSSRACCHSRFARTVMPNRRGDSCTLWGPSGPSRTRRPVRVEIPLSAHHSAKVKT